MHLIQSMLNCALKLENCQVNSLVIFKIHRAQISFTLKSRKENSFQALLMLDKIRRSQFFQGSLTIQCSSIH